MVADASYPATIAYPQLKTKIVDRNLSRLIALGFEVVGDLIHTIGPFVHCQPRFDKTQTRAQRNEAGIVAKFRHAIPEQEPGAIAFAHRDQAVSGIFLATLAKDLLIDLGER